MDQDAGNVGIRSGMKIVYTAVGGEKRFFILNQAAPRAVIGRNPDCEMLTDCPSVSRYHAILSWENGSVFVTFPPSGPAMNGLKVDGMSLLEDERLEVFPGTILTVGDFIAEAYAVEAAVDPAAAPAPAVNPAPAPEFSLDEGLVFFWRYGIDEIRSFWMNSHNRLAVIGCRPECELCIPACCDKIAPHHAVLLWLAAMDRERVYICRHPDCTWQETILDCGSMHEKKLDNNMRGFYSESVFRIGDAEVFAFYPSHAFNLLGVPAQKFQIKHDTAQKIDEIMSAANEQMRMQHNIERMHSQMMVGYGPPPV